MVAVYMAGIQGVRLINIQSCRLFSSESCMSGTEKTEIALGILGIQSKKDQNKTKRKKKNLRLFPDFA